MPIVPDVSNNAQLQTNRWSIISDVASNETRSKSSHSFGNSRLAAESNGRPFTVV